MNLLINFWKTSKVFWLYSSFLLFISFQPSAIHNAFPTDALSNSNVSVLSIPKPEYEAYQKGEKLWFSLSYSFITAGKALFEIKEDIKIFQKKPHMMIYVEGKSNSFFDNFFKVRDYYATWIDAETFLPSYYYRNTSEGGTKAKEEYIFNQSNQTADFGNGEKIKSQSELFDIISCFYYVRNIDFSNKKPGYEINFDAYYDKKSFPVGVKYLGKDILKTSLGKFKVLKFQPKLIQGRIFKNQSDMFLYVTDDKNQIPIRIKSAVYLDYVYADLVKMEGLKYPLTSKIK